MDFSTMREHCLGKPGVWLDNPFHEDRPVAKVGNGHRAKIFAFLGERTVGLKAALTREEADEWLARYPHDAEVMAYIGRSGWNTLRLGGAIADPEVLEALDDSYRLVVGRMPTKDRPTGWDAHR